jgi:hypothetical protein
MLPDFLRRSGLERGPLGLVNTIEELFEREGSGSGLERREYGRKFRGADYSTPLSAMLAITSPANGGRSVSIVRSRTEATECKYVGLFVKYFISSKWKKTRIYY